MTGLYIAAFGLLVMVAAVLVWPLLSARRQEASRASYDLSVYQDQLDEVDRDVERGVLGKEEAEAARNEIARRMLAADELGKKASAKGESSSAAKNKRTPSPTLAAAVVLVLVAGGGAGLYAVLGSPGLGDQPMSVRVERARAQDQARAQEMENMLARVEAHLKQNPDDLRGWLILGQSYQGLDRFEDSLRAWKNAARLKPDDANILAAYAEAMVFVNDGRVTTEARALFDKALGLDADNVTAQFFKGEALAQAGKHEEAARIWIDMVNAAPPEAPWRAQVEARIRAVAEEGGFDPLAMGLPSVEDRMTMIRGMVERLARRLQQNPDDLAGWQRLARAYRVLGETEKADRAEARVRELREQGAGQGG